VSRTRATLRRAEFGFFGVCVNTRTHTPRFCGLTCSAGLLVFVTIFLRPCRTSWLIVGIDPQKRRTAQRLRLVLNTFAATASSQPTRRDKPEDGA
jgi:hypothetical protein